MGLAPLRGGPQEMAQLIADDTKRYGALIKAIGLKIS